MHQTTSTVRPSLEQGGRAHRGEFILGMSVALAGFYLASHSSDAAAGSFDLVQQVLETLFVVFRVLAIGLGVVVTQRLGSGDVEQANRGCPHGAGREQLGRCRGRAGLLLGWPPDAGHPERARGALANGHALHAAAGALDDAGGLQPEHGGRAAPTCTRANRC